MYDESVGIAHPTCLITTLLAAIVLWALPASATKEAKTPTYRIYPLRNGVCKLAGNHAFYRGDNAETYDYALYLWLILGGDKPILVDARLTNVAEMNRGAAHVLREPITQSEQESRRAQLRKFGLTPADIGHVFITHMHFDHVDDLPLYTNAKVYVGKKEWQGATSQSPSWGHRPMMEAFLNDPQCRSRLVLVEDQEVLPGIESFWIGGHTPGSTAYRIRTSAGWAVITGDTISLLAKFVVNRREYEETSRGASDERSGVGKDVREALAKRPGALQLVEDEEVSSPATTH